MIDARDPFANEKAMTPTIMIMAQNSLSKLFVPEMSP